jgi:hypothetical protein
MEKVKILSGIKFKRQRFFLLTVFEVFCNFFSIIAFIPYFKHAQENVFLKEESLIEEKSD